MPISDTDIYKLNYFTYKKPFTGSCGNMRYRIVWEQKEGQENAHFLAAVYPQPFCWEDTPEEQKQKKEFPFSEEGRSRMIEWLNEKREEFEEEILKGTEKW